MRDESKIFINTFKLPFSPSTGGAGGRLQTATIEFDLAMSEE
jgi:hypothetical protein